MFAKRLGLLVCLMVGLLVARPNANNSGLVHDLGTATAGNIYVDINASGANNGTSWADAYTTIQAAIDAAAPSGDTIHVADGTYYEGLVVSGKTVSIVGAGRRQTFLDGGGTQRVLWVGSDATVSLSGLTVQHGYSVNDTGAGGGGVYNAGTVTATDCAFTNNTGRPHGGAVYNAGGATLRVTNCLFSSNTAKYSFGGAVYNYGGTIVAANCAFTGNSATSDGSNGGSGGAIYTEGPQNTFTNCTFTGNSATPDPYYGGNTWGGAIAVIDKGRVSVTNCVLWGDSAVRGSEIYTQDNAPSYYPEVIVSYSDVQGIDRVTDPYIKATSTIDIDPMFVAAPGNVRLLAGSPCIDVGDDSAITTENGFVNPPGVDLSGKPRIVGQHVDMGAYERYPDDTAPILDGMPAGITKEAAGPDGATATWTPPTASGDPDDADADLAITGTSNPGDTFPIGITPVTYTAMDLEGNSVSASFTVTVQDTTPPVIAPHANMTADATSASGVVVNYESPTWTDDVDVSGTAICQPASGSTFPIGPTTVTCTATDAAGNVGIATTFTVTVTNVAPPPSTITVTATPSTIWPPNKKMIPVKLVVTPANATARIVSVTCNEIIAWADTQITGALTVNLRADRNGNGTGRIYEIKVEYGTATPKATTTVQVKVPHDQGK